MFNLNKNNNNNNCMSVGKKVVNDKEKTRSEEGEMLSMSISRIVRIKILIPLEFFFEFLQRKSNNYSTSPDYNQSVGLLQRMVQPTSCKYYGCIVPLELMIENIV